jgi:hypothetical protein
MHKVIGAFLRAEGWHQGADPAAKTRNGSLGGVCTENLNPDVVMMKAAKDRA